MGKEPGQGSPLVLQEVLVLLVSCPCFSPSQTQIVNWKFKLNNLAPQKVKCSRIQLDENCDPKVETWSKRTKAAVSIFLLWAAAAKALGELGHLECLVVKQAKTA